MASVAGASEISVARARDVHVSTTDVHAADDDDSTAMDDDALFEAAAFDDDQGDAEPEPTRCRFFT